MAATGAVLEEIIASGRQRLAETRRRTSLDYWQQAAAARVERRDFARALPGEGTSGGGLSVIAELKRASPNRGLLCPDYRPQAIAEAYAAAGAAALSVLTEPRYFKGSLEDLQQARGAVSLPVLRKDFILDDYQVYESAAVGADAVLLIVAALGDQELRNLIQLCEGLRLAALVEVHDEEELDRAVAAGARIIGVNNRNLRTMEVKVETSFRLKEKIPAGCLSVSESGIRTAEDVRKLAAAGFDAVLIGERLMTAPDPGRALAELLGHGPVRAGND
jgi:indole-3-glycerol phosphate synthase